MTTDPSQSGHIPDDLDRYREGDQAAFLRNLGIESRAAVLRKAVPPSKVPEIDAALDRLTSTSRTGMGSLFKVIGCAHPKLGALPAF